MKAASNGGPSSPLTTLGGPKLARTQSGASAVARDSAAATAAVASAATTGAGAAGPGGGNATPGAVPASTSTSTAAASGSGVAAAGTVVGNGDVREPTSVGKNVKGKKNRGGGGGGGGGGGAGRPGGADSSMTGAPSASAVATAAAISANNAVTTPVSVAQPSAPADLQMHQLGTIAAAEWVNGLVSMLFLFAQIASLLGAEYYRYLTNGVLWLLMLRCARAAVIVHIDAVSRTPFQLVLAAPHVVALGIITGLTAVFCLGHVSIGQVCLLVAPEVLYAATWLPGMATKFASGQQTNPQVGASIGSSLVVALDVAITVGLLPILLSWDEHLYISTSRSSLLGASCMLCAWLLQISMLFKRSGSGWIQQAADMGCWQPCPPPADGVPVVEWSAGQTFRHGDVVQYQERFYQAQGYKTRCIPTDMDAVTNYRLFANPWLCPLSILSVHFVILLVHAALVAFSQPMRVYLAALFAATASFWHAAIMLRSHA